MRLKSAPKIEKGSQPASIVLSDGVVQTFYTRKKKDKDGKIVSEKVTLDRDIKGRVIMEKEDFLKLSKNIIRLQKWAEYVESTTKEFNSVGNTKK